MVLGQIVLQTAGNDFDEFEPVSFYAVAISTQYLPEPNIILGLNIDGSNFPVTIPATNQNGETRFSTGLGVGTHQVYMYYNNIKSNTLTITVHAEPARIERVTLNALGNTNIQVGNTIEFEVKLFDQDGKPFTQTTSVHLTVDNRAQQSFTMIGGTGVITQKFNTAGSIDVFAVSDATSRSSNHVSVTVSSIPDPDPDPDPNPLPGDIDPMWLVAGALILGVGAFAVGGGLKKLPKVL